MAQNQNIVVAQLHITREPGYLYFIKGTSVHRASKATKEKQLVARADFTREAGFLYYLDKNGHIARSPMKRRGA